MKIIYSPLNTNDSEDFFHLAGDERVAATMRFDCPRTKEESDIILADYVSKGNKTFALRFQPEGEMFGIFAFKKNGESGSYSLSHMILPKYWGKGLSKQVLKDMLELAREKKGHKVLEGYVLETNTASCKIAEKNGFKEKERNRFSGMTEDLIVYRLEL